MLKAFLPLERTLREHWSKQRYGVVDDGDGIAGEAPRIQQLTAKSRPRLNLDLVTEATSSSWFWLYMRMLIVMQEIIERVSWWASSCVCHETLLGGSALSAEADTARTNRHQLLKRFEVCAGGQAGLGVHAHCPCNGMRAPQCAVGELEVVFSTVCAFKSTALLLEIGSHGASGDIQQRITRDFDSAKSYLQGALRVKTQYWGLLQCAWPALAIMSIALLCHVLHRAWLHMTRALQVPRIIV